MKQCRFLKLMLPPFNMFITVNESKIPVRSELVVEQIGRKEGQKE